MDPAGVSGAAYSAWDMRSLWGERTPMATSLESVDDNRGTHPEDVKLIQALLNRIPPHEGGPDPKLTVDGRAGPETIAAILAVQRHHTLPTDGALGWEA